MLPEAPEPLTPAPTPPAPILRAPASSARRSNVAAQREGSQTNSLIVASHWGIWALPVWATLLFLGTLTHQPDPTTAFPAFARYVTTPEFLYSHLFASIVGAAIGTLGFTALLLLLSETRGARLALWGFVAASVGNTVITAIFGAAAFAQPAIGRAYLAGHTAEAVSLYQDVYGPALFATALPALALVATGLVLFGVAVVRSGSLPQRAGMGLAVGAVLFAVIGFVLADVVQSIGAVTLVASAAWIALADWRLYHPRASSDARIPPGG